MKQNKTRPYQVIIIYLMTSFLLFQNSFSQGVGINTLGLSPDGSAILDVFSANRGILIPRVALLNVGDKITVPEPARSLLVYNTSQNVIDFPLGEGYYFNYGEPDKANWVKLLNDGDISNTWFLGGNIVTPANYLGSSNAADLVFKTFGQEVMRFTSGGALLATGNTTAGLTPVSGAGSRLMWVPKKAAFRVGLVSEFKPNSWDDVNIGSISFATGYDCIASGSYSVAMGSQALAAGTSSMALNSKTTASGANSIAAGSNTTTNGSYSFTMGEYTVANAIASVAVGRYNVITKQNPNVLCTDTIFQIGNGISDALRRDALWVTRKGDLFVNGIVTANLMACPSDIRLKTAITPLKNVLNNIDHIQPITYYFKDKTNYPSTHQIGFSAQEIEKEFPELVSKNEAGYLSVNYPQMTAVAIQCIKEQQEVIKSQEEKLAQQQLLIDQLTTENVEIKTRLDKLEKMLLIKN